MKKKETDEPGMMLRIVTLLQFVPGHAKTPDGPPIGILTLGHKGEVEQPMSLTLKDTEQLAINCLEVLASHGHEFANYLIDTYLGPDSNRGPDTDDDDPAEAWKRK